MTTFKLFISCCLAWLSVHTCFAQTANLNEGSLAEITALVKTDSALKLKVASINISGNKRTKTYIILREVSFKKGDSIYIRNLLDTLEQIRYQIYNTNLFTQVDVRPVIISAFEFRVEISVIEKWYIYPTPQFQFVDRNVNEWLHTYHADFNRVVYGVKFAHYNFSGRGDQLRIYLLNGYSRNVSFSYNAPYSNSRLTEGFSVSGGYTQNREIPYKTSDSNKILNFKKPGFVRNNLYFALSYQLRKGFFKRHSFVAGYSYVNLNDSVMDAKYNPNYFNSRKSSLAIVELSYSMSYANTDNNNYPLKGKKYGYTFLKRGLGISGNINMLSISGNYNQYFPHGKNWYSVGQLYSKVILPFRQSYVNQRSIGYSDFYLRGLEYYVIDGVAAFVSKYTLKKKILSFSFHIPFNIHIKSIPIVPINVYAKTYADAGYSYIQKEFNTRLNNQFLYTGGFGLDILSVYDAAIGLEYSFNQLGENGLFLHAKLGF